MKVNDMRTKEVIDISVGDFLVSGDNDLFVIADISNFSDEEYGIIDITELNLVDVNDTIEGLLKSFDKDYALKEIIPQSRVSINIT